MSAEGRERWIVAHARANPEHRTTESLGTPGECETCGAKAPGWELTDRVVASLPEHDGNTCPYPDDFCTHECVCHVPALACLLHPVERRGVEW
jgi:hypothetical protein